MIDLEPLLLQPGVKLKLQPMDDLLIASLLEALAYHSQPVGKRKVPEGKQLSIVVGEEVTDISQT